MLVGLSAGWLAACATYQDGSEQPLGDFNPAEGGTATAGSGDEIAGSGVAMAGTSPAAGGGSMGGGSAGGASSAGSGGSAGGGRAGAPSTGGGASAPGGGGAAGTAGADGNDQCPDDPVKTAPGKCGCGAADVDSVKGVSCVPLQSSLIHRYSFEGDAKDSVGTAHGTLMGGATISDGALSLAGAKSGQYLDLPNGLISSLTSLTIEAYVTWTGSGGGDWQRVFDFGSSDMAEGAAGTGDKYLFLSARTLRACYTNASPSAEIYTDSNTPLTASPTQLAVVVDGTAHTLTLFLEGNSTGAAVPLTQPLSAINDVNNWLGRSQFANDDYFAGKISEFRIYDAALTGPLLKTSRAMGENTTYLEKQ